MIDLVDSDVEVVEEVAAPNEDERLDEVWAELETCRRECTPADMEDHPAFYVSLLGGKKTKEKTGCAYDYWMGRARQNGLGAVFLEAQGMPQSARFSTSTFGPRDAALIAQAWCRKMQFFLDVAVSINDLDHTFTQEDLALFKEPPILEDLLSSKVCPDRKRLLWLRNLRPPM